MGVIIFRFFFSFILFFRDHHPEDVFSSMETIMSLVLEESEDISVELLSLLLANVKKGDEVNYFYHFYGHRYSNYCE